MKTNRNGAANRPGVDVDAALATAAQGEAPTSDDANELLEDERRETDIIGIAAGVAVADGKPLGGPDEISRRDAHRWELDPSSADEPPPVDDTSTRPRDSSGER